MRCKPNCRTRIFLKSCGILCVLAALLGAAHAARHRKAADPGAPRSFMTASQPPAFRIPVDDLGYSAPSSHYFGQRESSMSLDFLGEDRLLFTFRAPGLIRRSAEAAGTDERRIRAVVLKLPQGLVESEALWTLHDVTRYLWQVPGGRFLLRDRDSLQLGDATLALKPVLRFPGPLEWMQLDPSGQILVTTSREPVPSNSPAGTPETVLRILRRDSGKVLLVSRVRANVHLAITSEGYLETLRGNGREWVLNLNYFGGGSRIVGRVESSCAPVLEPLSDARAMATTCAANGTLGMVALNLDGLHLWDTAMQATDVWPRLVTAPSAPRLARETIVVSHPVDAFSPLGVDDLRGQRVDIYDANSGRPALSAPASPILDGGGNVALSPSGRRVAILNAGAIEVYELPATQSAAAPAAKAENRP